MVENYIFPKKSWKNIERFDPAWEERIAYMASFVEKECDKSVLDVGCGPMWLRKHLPESTTYTALDYMYRGKDMIVCDLNSDIFPSINVDVCFISGCLEYIEKPLEFAKAISSTSRKCILSYCSTEFFPIIRDRQKRGWRNHFNLPELDEMFMQVGMRKTHQSLTPSNNAILVYVAR